MWNCRTYLCSDPPRCPKEQIMVTPGFTRNCQLWTCTETLDGHTLDGNGAQPDPHLDVHANTKLDATTESDELGFVFLGVFLTFCFIVLICALVYGYIHRYAVITWIRSTFGGCCRKIGQGTRPSAGDRPHPSEQTRSHFDLMELGCRDVARPFGLDAARMQSPLPLPTITFPSESSRWNHGSRSETSDANPMIPVLMEGNPSPSAPPLWSALPPSYSGTDSSSPRSSMTTSPSSSSSTSSTTTIIPAPSRYLSPALATATTTRTARNLSGPRSTTPTPSSDSASSSSSRSDGPHSHDEPALPPQPEPTPVAPPSRRGRRVSGNTRYNLRRTQ